MLIRLATPADLAAVDALFALSYGRQLAGAYPPSLLVMAVPRLARAQPRLLASGRYWLAEEDGAILGAGGWTPGAPGRGEVRHVVADHRRARQGIGRAVMTAAMAQARAAGIARLDCCATLAAEPFYAALGFRSLGRVVLDLGPGIAFPAVSMACDLPS